MDAGVDVDQWLRCSNDVNATTMLTSPNPSPVAGGKRSRTPRKPFPATYLKANPSNFRTIVQKFTGRTAAGCRRRGPITLNFASASLDEDILAKFGFGNNCFLKRAQVSRSFAVGPHNYGYTLDNNHEIWPQGEEGLWHKEHHRMDPHGGFCMEDYDNVMMGACHMGGGYGRDDNDDHNHNNHHGLTTMSSSRSENGRESHQHHVDELDDEMAMLEEFMMNDLYMLLNE